MERESQGGIYLEQEEIMRLMVYMSTAEITGRYFIIVCSRETLCFCGIFSGDILEGRGEAMKFMSAFSLVQIFREFKSVSRNTLFILLGLILCVECRFTSQDGNGLVTDDSDYAFSAIHQ